MGGEKSLRLHPPRAYYGVRYGRNIGHMADHFRRNRTDRGKAKAWR